MATHRQAWVKVNAEVDAGMVKIISALSALPGLQTLQSCEGTGLPEAYVYFWFGSWQQVSQLVFGGIIPTLQAEGIECTGAVEVFNGSLPTAKVAFNAAALDKATAAIERFVSESSSDRKNGFARDTGYRARAC